MANAKFSFIPDVWVKCVYEGHICLGRTFYGKKSAKMKPKMISLVFETGESIVASFSLVRKVVILKILTVTEFEKEFSIDSKIKSSGKLNQVSLALAQHQLKTSMSYPN